jgi:hypothetical protein
MGTNQPPASESEEVPCLMPPDYEADEETMSILNGPPDEEGE